MKKTALLLLVIALTVSGCFLFDDEQADELLLPQEDVIEEIQNNNVDKASDEIAEQEEESAAEEAEEELAVDQVFKGTWWLYMKYPEMRTVSEMNVLPGSFDSKKHYSGDIQTMKSDLYGIGTDEHLTAGINPELADYEIDGQKIRISTSNVSLFGKIILDQSKSYAKGDFLGTAGEGFWYMTNQKSDSDWEEL